MAKYRNRFFKHVQRQCKKYKIKFILLDKHGFDGTEGDTSCGGYFIDNPLEIGIATETHYKDVLATLVHEFSHFEQFQDKSPFYTKKYRGLDPGTLFCNWLDGREYKKATINSCIDIIRDCELDCDRRALVNIRKFKIPIGIKDYCRKSSAYLHFHNFVKLSRKWEYKKYPGTFPPIVNKMPTNLDGDYSKTPKEIIKLYRKYLSS